MKQEPLQGWTPNNDIFQPLLYEKCPGYCMKNRQFDTWIGSTDFWITWEASTSAGTRDNNTKEDE